MCDYPFFIPQVVLFANSSLFWFKVTNEHREFRNYLFSILKSPFCFPIEYYNFLNTTIATVSRDYLYYYNQSYTVVFSLYFFSSASNSLIRLCAISARFFSRSVFFISARRPALSPSSHVFFV